ncbi:hypothetical protein Gotri_012860, partial [Gossypium trilobum]|nr:hypothetical protein [Gossypium trilobum]
MAGSRVAHATLKGPSVVKEIVIGITLGLCAGGLWKMHHWNEQRKVRAFYDMLEKGFPVLVVVLHMLRTHHSSYEHPVISLLELPVTWFLRASRSALYELPDMAHLDFLIYDYHELPDNSSSELP